MWNKYLVSYFINIVLCRNFYSKIESIQYNAVLAVTGALHGTSMENYQSWTCS